MTEAIRAFVERMSRFTTRSDEFSAQTPEGQALRADYNDEDMYMADTSDDRLLDELHCFEEMIRDAREVLAQPDPMLSALKAAEYWIDEQAWSPIAENGDVLRVIRDALAGKAMAPLTGPFHGPGLADQCRLVTSLIGTDSQQGRNEARQTALRIADVSSKMLAALQLAEERLEICDCEGEEAENLAVIRAAIAAANGEA